MFKKLILASVIALSGTVGLADSELPENWTLQCNLNRSQSLFLYQETESVWYSHFLRETLPLEMTSFQVYRCPFCYSFEGQVNGRTYSGMTRGTMNQETRKWEVNLELEIDGVKQGNGIYCFQP
jgi:hypothetical protein